MWILSHLKSLPISVFIFVSLAFQNDLLVFSREDVTTDPQKDQSQMKIAICLTGQLVRLELLSKIHNLVAHNAVRLGHEIDLFVMLDNDIAVVKQTFWKFDYSNSIFQNFTATNLHTYIEKNIAISVTQILTEDDIITKKNYAFKPKITVRVILAPPTQNTFVMTRGISPVGEKMGPNINGKQLPAEPAESRFQNNMRWMGALRECVKWVMETENEQQYFYD
jgi:hypothetical protein